MGGASSRSPVTSAQHAPRDLRPEDPGDKPLVLDHGLQTTVEISVRLEGLKRSYPTFVIAYTRSAGDVSWVELGKTEASPESRHPVFSRNFSVDFRIEERRELRIEVYRVRDQIELGDLNAQAFLGCAEVKLTELFIARRGVANKGWWVRELEHPRPPCCGKVWLYAEETYLTKNVVSFRLTAKELRIPESWALRLNPYCIFYRVVPAAGEEVYVPIYRSEVCRSTSTPKWARVELPVQAMFVREDSAKMLIEVYTWSRLGTDERIGVCTLSFKDAQGAFKTSGKFQMALLKDRVGPTTGSMLSMPSMPSSAVSSSKMSSAQAGVTGNGNAHKVGKLWFEDCGMLRRYSFLDFVRGGMDLNTVVGIDFTRSNVNPQDPNSLHRLKGDAPSDYVTAMRAIGSTLADFDPSREFAPYGFGAKLPPSQTISSDCFSVVGDYFDPKIIGVEALVRAYQRALHVVHLHGPTKFASLIRTATHYAGCYSEATDELKTFKVPMKYTVLLIFTDGQFLDVKETLQELAKATHFPLSVIIVGMGDADLSNLEDLQDDVFATHRLQKTELPTAARRVVTYIPFREHCKDPIGLAKAMIKSLPADLLKYYDASNIKPRKLDSFEDTAGNPLPKQIVDLEAREKKEWQRNAAEARERETSGSRNGTFSNQGTKETPSHHRSWSGTRSTSTNNAGSSNSDRTLSSLPHGHDGTVDEFIRKKREFEKHMASLPPFLKEQREELASKALKHGYPKHAIERALKEGVPDAGFECLVETLTCCRNGTGTLMKEAAQQAIPVTPVHASGGSGSSKQRRLSHSHTTSKISTDAGPNAIVRTRSVMSGTSNTSVASHMIVPADQNLPGQIDTAEIASCRVCLERVVNTEFFPCGHRLACDVCAEKLGPVCLLCQGTIKGIRKLHASSSKTPALKKLADSTR